MGKKKNIYFIICACEFLHMCRCPRSHKRIQIPATGVTKSCEILDAGAENRTYVLCKKGLCSYPLSHLSSPSLYLPNTAVLSFMSFHPMEATPYAVWWAGGLLVPFPPAPSLAPLHSSEKPGKSPERHWVAELKARHF